MTESCECFDILLLMLCTLLRLYVNRIEVKSTPVSKKLKFSGKITKMGDNRVIWIPKRLHGDIEGYEDKQLIITIELAKT